jgi:hypothetical protein
MVQEYIRHIHVVLEGQISLMHFSWLQLVITMFDLMVNLQCHHTLPPPLALPVVLQLGELGNHEVLVLVVVSHVVYGVMDHRQTYKILCTQQ